MYITPCRFDRNRPGKRNAFFTVDEDLDLLSAVDVNRIGAEMVALRESSGLPWRVVAFDTHADHMPDEDERNETTFSTPKKHLLHISRQTGAAVMLVHRTS
ncbi:hypothetical protein [Dactylosporangium sp. NPDC051541]|uniref:hypothetical protein n=1 Tax=Dactylosporangium sp. NPDC051541 TaxID=3363977 RepID=UPI0037BB5EFD